MHALKWDIPFVGHVDTGLGFAAYNGLTAVIANLVVAALLSLVVRSKAPDETSPEDYRRSRLRLSVAPIGRGPPRISSAFASARMSRPGVALLSGLPQQIRGVKHRHGADYASVFALVVIPAPPRAGDSLAHAEQRLRRRGPEADQDLGARRVRFAAG